MNKHDLTSSDYSLHARLSGRFLLCVPAGWESYISGEFFEIHQKLVEKGWTKLVIDEISDDETIRAIFESDLTLLWEAYEFLERNEAILCKNHEKKTKRLFFCDDVHYFTSHRRAQRLRAFEWADLILATYPNKLSQWYSQVTVNKIISMPHSAASYFHTPERTDLPTDRLLLSGAKTWPYPFRQFCATKLDMSICDVIEHPGYPGYPGDQANKPSADFTALSKLGRERYATLLRTYPAMLVCGSIFGYLVAKVFEGMAAGCLTICERHSLGAQLTSLGFEDGQHYIATDIPTVIEDSNNFIKKYTRDASQWKHITRAAAKKVAEEHTTTVRAAKIHSMCMEINQS